MNLFLTVRPFYAVQWLSKHSFSGVTVNVKNALNSGRNPDLLNQLKRKRAYSGEMTHHSQKRMQRAVENLWAISKPQLIYRPDKKLPIQFTINFITLTLPAEQFPLTDSAVHETIFIPWLEYAKRRFRLSSYVWKCERQKNGNLHYHLLSNCWIDKNELSKTWNYHCEKLGLITKFKTKHQHENPPSTQVQAVQNSSEVQRYIRKYVGKKIGNNSKQLGLLDEERLLKGVKCWDASKNLKTKTNATVKIDARLKATLDYTQWLTPKSVYKSDYFTVYKRNMTTDTEIMTEHVSAEYLRWTESIKHPNQKQYEQQQTQNQSKLALVQNTEPDTQTCAQSQGGEMVKAAQPANHKIHRQLFITRHYI